MNADGTVNLAEPAERLVVGLSTLSDEAVEPKSRRGGWEKEDEEEEEEDYSD
jgi:hypothetical protein